MHSWYSEPSVFTYGHLQYKLMYCTKPFLVINDQVFQIYEMATVYRREYSQLQIFLFFHELYPWTQSPSEANCGFREAVL